MNQQNESEFRQGSVGGGGCLVRRRGGVGGVERRGRGGVGGSAICRSL